MEFRFQRHPLRNPRAPIRPGKPLRATALCGALAALVVGGGLGIVSGSARAEATENKVEEQNTERATDTRASREKPTRMRPLEKRMMRLQKKTDWWQHARRILFTDLELSEEQLREADTLIEKQLRARAEFLEGDARFKTARRHDTREEIEVIRAELREIKKRLRDRHEVFEDLRALLREEQRPTFDMNRARLVAEDQDQTEAPEPSTPEGIPVSSRRIPSS